jgi:DNA polymerase-3 subunit delta'
MSDVFDHVYGQPRVREYLRAVIAEDRVGQAYLFTGPAGSNKTQAAFAFAEALLLTETDDASERARISRQITRRTHPDVHYIAPEGARNYLIEQIRQVVEDVSMKPVQARRKIYIFDRADLMGTSAANAFLKTLEEPPDDVVMILLGRTRDSVLPTIVSRCQVVAFRQIPPEESAQLVVQNIGCSLVEARIAIQAVGGSTSKAVEFLRSNERMGFRRSILSCIAGLQRADDLDVLDYARQMTEATKSPLDEVRRQQEALREEQAEYLQKSALKALADRDKRRLTKANLDLLQQMVSIVASFLRDVMVICAGRPELIVNVDVATALEDCAGHTTTERCVRALDRTKAAEQAISYNVSPQTSIEAMLFEIREVLYAKGR